MGKILSHVAVWVCLFCSVACLIGPGAAASAENPLDTWTQITTLPSPDKDISMLFYADGRFLVTRGNGVYSSQDLATWAGPLSYTNAGGTWYNKFVDIAYGNQMFMGVEFNYYCIMCNDGTLNHYGKIFTSADGLNWTLRYETNQSPINYPVPIPAEGGFDRVEYREGLFRVRVLQRYGPYEIWTSADGVGWQKNVGGVFDPDIASGNGRHVYVENDTAYSSTDRINWTPTKVGKDLGLAAVTFGNGTFAAVGGKGKIYLSADGIFWKAKETGTAQDLKTIVFVDDRFYVAGKGGAFLHSGPLFTYSLEVGTSGVGKGRVRSDPAGIDCGSACFQHYDAKTYVQLTATPDQGSLFAGWSGACNGKSPTCLVPVESVRYAIAHFDSEDPLNSSWTAKEVPTAENLLGVAGGNGTLVAVGANGAIVTSTDGGISWVDRTVSLWYGLTGVTYGNQMFLAIGPDGTKATSPDGLTWTVARPVEYQPKNAVVCGNGTFVVAGGIYGSGTAVFETSPDGQSWTETSVTPASDVKSIAYGGNTFVAVGNDFVMTSQDGANWTTQQLHAEGCTYTYLKSITYGTGLFVAVGNGYLSNTYPGIIFTSPDGVTWTQRPSGVNVPLTQVSYGGGTFLAFGEGGLVLASKDGISWQAKLPIEGPPLAGATFVDGAFIAVGEGGKMLQSGVLKGDLNMDGRIDLTDFVLGVRILSGNKPVQPVNRHADVGKTGKIGLQELLFILQKTAGVR